MVLGAALLFAYALGMGLPFFLIGAFSVSLPKSGAWMESIKSVFGVALLAAAGIYLRDLAAGAQALVLGGRLGGALGGGAAAAGVLLGALHPSFHGPALERALKALGVILVVGGVVYASARRARRATGPAGPGLRLVALRGGGAGAGPGRAAAGHHRLLGRVVHRLQGARPARLGRSAGAGGGPPLRDDQGGRHRDHRRGGGAPEKYDVPGMPTVIFIDSNGREVTDRVIGAVEADEMLQRLEAVDGACARPVPQGALACAARW